MLALAGLALGACSSISEKFTSVGSSIPGIALPENAPARPATQLAYPAVHDMPPARNNTLLNEIEQKRLEADLEHARDRQQAVAGQKPAARRKQAEPAPRVVPASMPGGSGRTIY